MGPGGGGGGPEPSAVSVSAGGVIASILAVIFVLRAKGVKSTASVNIK